MVAARWKIRFEKISIDKQPEREQIEYTCQIIYGWLIILCENRLRILSIFTFSVGNALANTMAWEEIVFGILSIVFTLSVTAWCDESDDGERERNCSIKDNRNSNSGKKLADNLKYFNTETSWNPLKRS